MSRLKILLLMLATLAGSACQSISVLSPTSSAEKLERVGILLSVSCEQAQDCAPYHLLGPDMRNRTALIGDIPSALTGQLIAVLGRSVDQQQALETLRVSKTIAITDFDYQPFLARAVAQHIEQNYHCTSFWDRRYGWRLEGRQPIILATLSHPSTQNTAQLELAFDGLNQALMSETKDPIDLDPCRIN
ncbi:MAG: hypothetical protein KAG66_04070 [Methylococcales bacterium]|nr:hypothetical protein [Methylococcales bacterium]